MASSQRMSSTLARVPKFATTPYVCATCRSRSQFQLPSRPDTQQARSNSDIPFTEKLRRKIWGTDNPPGLKDPYGGPSFLERRLAQRKQRRGEVEEATEVPPEPTDVGSTRFPTPQSEETQSPTTSRSRRGRSYNPHGFESATPAPVRPPTYLGPRPYRKAETWEGLEWLGHRGEYQFQDPKEADEYTPYVPSPCSEHAVVSLTDCSTDGLTPAKGWSNLMKLKYGNSLALHLSRSRVARRLRLMHRHSLCASLRWTTSTLPSTR